MTPEERQHREETRQRRLRLLKERSFMNLLSVSKNILGVKATYLQSVDDMLAEDVEKVWGEVNSYYNTRDKILQDLSDLIDASHSTIVKEELNRLYRHIEQGT